MVVLNMPILDTRGRSEDDPTGEMISKIVLTIMAWMAQKETEERKRRQKEGIEVAKREGKYKGRKPVEVNRYEFGKMLEEVRSGARTNKYAMEKLGLTRTTYYKLIEEYDNGIGRFKEE